VVRRLASNEQRLAAGLPVYKGRAFCGRKCQGEWLGAMKKDRQPRRHGTIRCYRMGCREPECVAAVKASNAAYAAHRRAERAARAVSVVS